MQPYLLITVKEIQIMPDKTDLLKLYSNRILGLAATMPHVGRLAKPDASAVRRSPLCGSKVIVDVTMRDGMVEEFAQDVKACALGQAAASITGQNILGATPENIKKARDQLEIMLKDGGPTPEPPFEGFEVLTPAVEYKNRHASILLVLQAASDACDKVLVK
jgi:NifU-like protein involved in Fe-S cluster formation